MSAEGKVEAIIRGVSVGFLTFIGVEIAAGLLSVLVRLVEQYTHWFYLDDSWNAWLGVVFLYWAIFPAGFIGLVVGARVGKSRWNQDSSSIR